MEVRVGNWHTQLYCIAFDHVKGELCWVPFEFCHRFEEGAEQFRLDVAQNPNDTEESIWCFLCEAQLYGVDEARKQYLEASH